MLTPLHAERADKGATFFYLTVEESSDKLVEAVGVVADFLLRHLIVLQVAGVILVVGGHIYEIGRAHV